MGQLLGSWLPSNHSNLKQNDHNTQWTFHISLGLWINIYGKSLSVIFNPFKLCVFATHTHSHTHTHTCIHHICTNTTYAHGTYHTPTSTPTHSHPHPPTHTHTHPLTPTPTYSHPHPPTHTHSIPTYTSPLPNTHPLTQVK